jgi:hypothetical protein
MSISQCGNLIGAMDKSVGNVSAISGMYTKRSPYIKRFKNMEDEDSLSITPVSKLDKSDLAVSGGLTKNFELQKDRVSQKSAENLQSSTNEMQSSNLRHQQL